MTTVSDRTAIREIYKILITCLRIIVGVVFVVASIPKIMDPAKFANILNAYQLLPVYTLGIVSWLLPWAECIVGSFLIVGYKIKLNIAIATLMMTMFLIAVISAMARGLDIDCGCFGRPEAVGWRVVSRDVGLLAVLAMCASHYLCLSVKERTAISRLTKHADS